MNTSSASVQTTVPMLTGVYQVVNDGPGDQLDTHTTCERVVYLNEAVAV